MKQFFQLILAVFCLAFFVGHLKDRQRHRPDSSAVVRHFQQEVAPSQSRATRPRVQRPYEQTRRMPVTVVGESLRAHSQYLQSAVSRLQ